MAVWCALRCAAPWLMSGSQGHRKVYTLLLVDFGSKKLNGMCDA